MLQGKRKRKLLICIAAVLGFCAALFVTLLLVSGVFEKPKYLEPWSMEYANRFDDPRLKLVADGLLAANGHNMQPWLIKLDQNDPTVFYLYADAARMTNEVDPLARQFMVTQGTFLGYVETAGKKLGYDANFVLFPDGGYDERNLAESMAEKPVAKISLTKTEPKDEPLYDMMFLPDTNRGAYGADPLTDSQKTAIQAITMDSGISLKIYEDAGNLSKIGDYAMSSAVVEANTARVMQETAGVFRSNEYQKNRYRYGFSVEGQGASGLMMQIMQGLLTICPSLNTGKAATGNFISSTRASIDSTPAYVMILSDSNSRVAQVESGILYSRLVLTAHEYGLAVQPLSQALEEYPEMKELYDGIHREYAPGGQMIQMLFRIGKPEREAPLSMRRDVSELILSN